MLGQHTFTLSHNSHINPFTLSHINPNNLVGANLRFRNPFKQFAFSSLGVCLKSEPKKLDGGDPSPEGEELERVETWNDGEPPSGPPQSTLHTGGFRGQMDALNEYV